MKQLTQLVAVAVTATGLTAVGFSTTAGAVTTVEVATANVSVRDNACATSRAVVTGDWYDATQAGNTVTVTLRKTGGGVVSSETFTDETTGSVELATRLCGGQHKPGEYKVKAVATTTYADPTLNTTTSAIDTFEFKRVVRKKSHMSGKVVRVKHPDYKFAAIGYLTRSGHGYKGQKVWLQVREGGQWFDATKARTRKKGYIGWYLKPNPYSWRFSFPGNSTTRPDTSKSFRTPSGGRVARADLTSLVGR